MNSVSNPSVNAAHLAKKPGKPEPSPTPTGDGAEFGTLFSSMQLGLQGQDLAAQAGNAAPTAACLASEILGPAVHIITSTTPTMDDDSLLAFARSQGMDESSLALIFQHAAPEASVLALADAASTKDAKALLDLNGMANLDQDDPLPHGLVALDKEQLALASEGNASDEKVPNLTIAPVALEPILDAQGMSMLDLGADGSMRWSVNQPGQLTTAELTLNTAAKSADEPATDVAATAAATAAAAVAALKQNASKEAPPNDLAATLLLGADEAAQFSKHLETKQILHRAEKLAALTGDAFKTASMSELSSLGAVQEPSTVKDTLSLGTELTGEDLQLIWAHRQQNAENSSNGNNTGSGAGQSASQQTNTELRADQYAKLTQRLGEALGQRLAAQIAKGDWNVELTLKPQDLGNIEIKLNMKDGNLEASFNASKAMTRDLIVDSLPRLKETLAQSGMEVAQLNVNVGQHGQNGGKSTPERQKASTAVSGVSTNSPVNAGLPTATLTTRKPETDNGLDVLV